jgi:flagellar motility protein MotE (MotC chaperone)
MKSLNIQLPPFAKIQGGALLQLMRRPLTMLLAASSMGIVAHALAVAAPQAGKEQPQSRLGASLQEAMAQRDQTLAAEKRRLDMREQAAKAAEARLAAEVRAQQEQADANSGTPQGRPNAPAQPNEPYDDLARIYQSMKPAKAAPIFQKLDLEVQTQVAKRMRDRSTALLMAAMNPNAAAELTMSLAGRVVKQRPAPEPSPRTRPASENSAPEQGKSR